MAQNGDSCQSSVETRLEKIENLLKQIFQNKQDETLASGESSSNRGSSNKSRKRAASDDRKEGSGRTENESFGCTLCDRKYQNKDSLFKHYRVNHRCKSPERMHKDNLAKKARIEDTNVNEGNKHNNCKLCETVFNTTSARNNHYTRKHRIKDEKLLFFPDGSALVESSYENEIRKNPQWLKVIDKRGMPAGVCKLCGVQLDNDDLKYHYEREHKVMQMSKVKNLIRLKNADIKEIAVCEICDNCSDTFNDREALENHKVSVHADLFKRCNICKKILEINNYNEHIKNEHPDFFFKKANVRITPAKVVEPQSANVPKTTTEKKDAKIAEETVKEQAKTGVRRASFRPQSKPNVPLMYMCDACNLVTTSYDNVIAHSQDHILNTVSKELKVCEICDLTFGVDYDVHKEMHSTDADLDRDSFRFIPYDYKNLANDKWLDIMFKSFSKSTGNQITSASIYFSTRCVRLKLLRDVKDASSQFTLFQCLTCLNYIHPKCVESHVGQRDACTNQTFNYQCVKCAKAFYTAEGRDEHAETHNIPDSDSRYRMVLFNDPSDFNFNKALLEHTGKSVIEKVVNGDIAKAKAVEKITIVTNPTEEKANNVTNGGTVADVYKCECGLCFDRFKSLLIHMQNCSNDLNKNERTECPCGLVFDRINFSYHCKVHDNYIRTFNVKKLILVDDVKIDARATSENFMKKNDEKLNKINSTSNQGTQKERKEHVQNVSIRTLEVSKDNDMSAVVDKEPDQQDVSMKEVGSNMNELNDALRKTQSECTGDTRTVDKTVDSVGENPKKDDENAGEHSKEVQKVATHLIARNGKPAVAIDRDDSNNNRNCTQDSENPQENNLMVETTITVELQQNVDNHIYVITSKSHDEEQLKLVKNDNCVQIKESREITTRALHQNEFIPDEIKKGNEVSIRKIAQQNKEHTAGQETKYERKSRST